MSFYDLTVTKQDGSEQSMADYKGKVVMVVNTATGCGFTPQYEDIVNIYNEYHDKGFEVVDVPCNQFRDQAPGTDAEITEFCTLNYGTPFPQMKKTDVNGENATPLFEYLKGEKGFEGFGKGVKAMGLKAAMKAMDKNYDKNDDIKWNFTKFIVDREGNVVARFEPTASMKDVADCVAALM